jgi:hypothetical protein
MVTDKNLKNQFKCIKDLNVRLETIKLLLKSGKTIQHWSSQ